MSAIKLQHAKVAHDSAIDIAAYAASHTSGPESMEITVCIPCDFTDGQTSVTLSHTDLERLFREKWRTSEHYSADSPGLPGRIDYQKAKVKRIVKQGVIVNRCPERSHTRMNLYNLRITDNASRKLVNGTRVFKAGRTGLASDPTESDFPLMHVGCVADDVVIFQADDSDEDEDLLHFSITSLTFYDKIRDTGAIYKTHVPGMKAQAVISLQATDTLDTLQTILRRPDIVQFGSYDPLTYREWRHERNNHDLAMGTIRLPLDLCERCVDAAKSYDQRVNDGKHDLTTVTIKLVPSSTKQTVEPEGSMSLVLTADVPFTELY